MTTRPRPRRRSVSWRAAAAATVLAGVAAGCGRDAPRPGATILIDNIHTTKRGQDQRLPWNDYRYIALSGTQRFFNHLAANGYSYRYVTRTDAPALTPEVLRGTDILYVDLVAAHGADFAPAEIEAILAWVARGGSLLVIGDHTNVYDNARRSNALLEPLGVRILYGTAMDRAPGRAREGGFFPAIAAFAPHPITRAVRAIFFQSGAPLETPHGVAFLSPQGFSDTWIPTRKHQSLIGNGVLDPGEPTGALPVVAAGTHGRGRFVVLGDANLLGNEALFVADNFELACNAFEWLARDESDMPPLRDRVTSPLHVAFDLEHCGWNIEGNECDGYFPFYIDFNRDTEVLTRGIPELAGRWDVLVFTDPEKPFAAAELAYVRAHVAAGGTVLLFTDVTRARPGSRQLLADLVPGIVLHGRRSFGIDALPAGEGSVETVVAAEEFPILSSVLDVTGLRMAGHQYPPGARCAFDVEKSRPYLHRVTATGGEPLLQAQVGAGVVDLARIYQVGNGGVVVFFQDGCFRNETLGWQQHAPGARTADSHRIVHAMVQWLKRMHRAAPARGEPGHR
jgi:hypothetical protein